MFLSIFGPSASLPRLGGTQLLTNLTLSKLNGHTNNHNKPLNKYRFLKWVWLKLFFFVKSLNGINAPVPLWKSHQLTFIITFQHILSGRHYISKRYNGGKSFITQVFLWKVHKNTCLSVTGTKGQTDINWDKLV